VNENGEAGDYVGEAFLSMFDHRLQLFARPYVSAMAHHLAAVGITANQLTLSGFLIGLLAAVLIAQGFFLMGLAAVLVSRLLDALDGAVARLRQTSDVGGFLDITLDFVFYASIPLAFALYDPTNNALAAAVLLASFIGTGSSFLAFAIFATKRAMTNLSFPNKSFYFLGGLTEAGETILAFGLMCLLPNHFAAIAYGFSVLCLLTTGLRILWGWRQLK